MYRPTVKIIIRLPQFSITDLKGLGVMKTSVQMDVDSWLQSVCVCGKLCDGLEQKPKKLGELLSHYYDKGFSSVFLKREKHLKTFRWKEV